MTYKELKIDVLQKVGDGRNIQNGEIIQNTSTQTYISQIPNLLREALTIVSTAGRYIVKYLDIVNNPVIPEVDMKEIYQIRDTKMVVSLDKCKAYYFEVCGPATISIIVGDVLKRQIINNDTSTYKVYKGKIDNTNNEEVKIEFAHQYPYSVRNIGMYTADFPTDDDVYDNVAYKRYDLRKLLPDFYSLKNNDMPREAGIDVISYDNNTTYHWEGDSVLVLDNTQKGMWRVYYNSYPQDIPSNIEDDAVIEVLPEVAAIIPFYIAGQLLMAEDEDYSSERLNEFESRRAELVQVKELPASYNSEFENSVGW